MRRKYPNSDSIKVFKSICLYLRLIKFDSLISFLPAFLQKEDTHSMKYIHIHTHQIILIKLLSIPKPSSFFLLLSPIFQVPI